MGRYETTKQNISLHVQNISDGDGKKLQPTAVVKEYLTTAVKGMRCRALHTTIDLILLTQDEQEISKSHNVISSPSGNRPVCHIAAELA